MKRIAEIRECSSELTEDMKRHLTNSGPLSLSESGKAIYINKGKLEILVESLKKIIAGYDDEIDSKYYKWQSVVTGDGFPVNAAEYAFKQGDERVLRVSSAQLTFSVWLDSIEHQCIQKRLKWHSPGH